MARAGRPATQHWRLVHYQSAGTPRSVLVVVGGRIQRLACLDAHHRRRTLAEITPDKQLKSRAVIAARIRPLADPWTVILFILINDRKTNPCSGKFATGEAGGEVLPRPARGRPEVRGHPELPCPDEGDTAALGGTPVVRYSPAEQCGGQQAVDTRSPMARSRIGGHGCGEVQPTFAERPAGCACCWMPADTPGR